MVNPEIDRFPITVERRGCGKVAALEAKCAVQRHFSRKPHLATTMALIRAVSYRYTGPNENFVLVSGCSSGDLETNGFEERIQAIRDLLIETVERTALFFR